MGLDSVATTTQQPPTGNGADVTDLVMRDLVERRESGTRKYGRPLRTFNGRDALVDCYQELLDAVCYGRQLIEEARILETLRLPPVQPKTYSVEVIADSVNPDGQRITTMRATYWRAIHSEFMTHRAFSRNAASSRAIPIDRQIAQVLANPAGPIRWGCNGKGMQDHGCFSGEDEARCRAKWTEAAKAAAAQAVHLMRLGLHKQIANRVLEPFAWMTTLLTATDWENFFALRVHRDAMPEFQHVAHLMLKAYLASEPAPKDWGEWHLPYGDRLPEGTKERDRIRVAVGRAAWVSYDAMDKDSPPDAAGRTHDKIIANGHWSPTEHPAEAKPGRWGNFNGWRQYRKLFPNENRGCDLRALLSEYEAAQAEVER